MVFALSIEGSSSQTHRCANFGASASELNGMVDAEGLEPPTPSV